MSVSSRHGLLLAGVLAACTVRSDLLTDSAGGCLASDSCLALTASSTTPHAITFAWDAAALGDDVNGYMLGYATDEAQLAAGGAAVWDVERDPNLGWRYSPFGPKLVGRTTLRDLQPGTTYFAQLWARRRDGSSGVVAVGQAATLLEPPAQLVIFSEGEQTRPGVWLQGFDDPATAGAAHTGSQALWFDSCGFNGTDCTKGGWINARIGGLGLDASVISALRAASAYVEMFVQLAPLDGGDVTPVYYVDLRLSSGGGTIFLYGYPLYATLAGRTDWQRLEFPLAECVDAGGMPASEGLLQDTLSVFMIGAAWGAAVEVRVDDVVVRY